MNLNVYPLLSDKLKTIPLLIFLILLFSLNSSAQTGSVTGRIEDAATGETLIGATVLIQGTTKGAITDIDGNFLIKDIAEGTYNLVISYVSYEQQIIRANISRNSVTELNIRMNTASVEMDAVKIVANKRTDTEMALISNLKSGNLVASGISRQQIAKSQDKDASEVVSRVPGVSIRDGRYINVRGLDERYNVVNINGVAAPSSEADRRSFSFDMLPSSLIDNLVLLKTPSPEYPADFAGAIVLIQTKNTVENNSFEISYSTGYRQNTTFRDFYTYKGGKTDWLGFDDGSRALPDGFPETSVEFREIADNPDEIEKENITRWGKAFNKVWEPERKTAIPDQSLAMTVNRRFILGRVSVGNVTSLGYSIGQQFREVFRAGYDDYNSNQDRPDTAYYFNDDLYSTKARINGLFNWLLIFGKNQKIEFRNFYNHYGDKQSLLRTGVDNYGGDVHKRGTELNFQSRSIYTGQLNGTFNFRQSLSTLDWTVGYSYTNRFQPDIRRIERNRNAEGQYPLYVSFNADPTRLGRLHLSNYENIYVGAFNYNHKINMGNSMPTVKAGFLTELKDREFVARNIGFSRGNQFRIELLNQPLDSFFQDKNLEFNVLRIDESTNPSEAYTAGNALYAAYTSLDIPLGNLRIYGGIRLEKNVQTLNSFTGITQPYKVNNDTLDLFPSVNLTYNLTDKSLIRLAWGKTVNRPEFREISLHSFYDFEERATIYGNPDLLNAYINNVDFRYEFFPSNGDIITIGGFYKHFRNPIEAHIFESGSGRHYTFENAKEAASYGLEIDLRKSFSALENRAGTLRYLSHFVVVFNLSLIRSELNTTDPNARESERRMQGQSPYIVNTGIFYDDPDNGFLFSVLYNVIGPRLMYIGNKYEPHILQMPRNLIDITVSKRIGKYLTLKMGIKDLFNQPVELRQNERVQLINGASNEYVNRVQRTQIYKPSNSYMIGLSLNL